MEDYLLKSSASLIILYALYKIMLRYEFNHQFNRFIGLICLIFSAVLPFVHVPMNELHESNQFSETFRAVAAGSANLQQNVSSALSGNTLDIFLMIYAAGACLFLVRTLTGISTLGYMYLASPKAERWGFTVIQVNRQISPFTFFNLLFVGRNLMEDHEMDVMLRHERVHRDQLHSLDVILVELLTILFWFNPAVWLFRKDIKEQHEYFADERVLRTGINPITYQQILFKARTGTSVELASYLSATTSLSRRFKMMTASRLESKAIFWKASLFFILMSVLLFLGSFSERAAAIQVEALPTYEEGERAMYQKVMDEIKYPASARQNNRSGLVNISFTVTAKGEVTNVEAEAVRDAYVLKEIVVQAYFKSSEPAMGPDDALRTESIRAVSGLGRFVPAQKDGKAISYVMTLPVKFSLTESTR